MLLLLLLRYLLHLALALARGRLDLHDVLLLLHGVEDEGCRARLEDRCGTVDIGHERVGCGDLLHIGGPVWHKELGLAIDFLRELRGRVLRARRHRLERILVLGRGVVGKSSREGGRVGSIGRRGVSTLLAAEFIFGALEGDACGEDVLGTRVDQRAEQVLLGTLSKSKWL